MRLSEKYRPMTLRDVVGQPEVAKLRAFARRPFAMCWLFEGPPGVGKTSSAYALAGDLGCTDEFSGLFTVVGSDLSVERARELFTSTLRLRSMMGAGPFKVLVIEELENLSAQCGRFLKVALETQLPNDCVVVATSNDASGLDKALRQRFSILHFNGGPEFASDCADRLAQVWSREQPGRAISVDVLCQGWDDGQFSMRRALDALQWC